MIHLGKSYCHDGRSTNENKENIDNNLIRLKPVEKGMKDHPKQPTLLKKLSSTTTACSQEPEIDSLGLHLKSVYTAMVCEDYSQDIFGHITQRQLGLDTFLEQHSISTSLRAKMVDWMIEVLSSYKMTEQTFFKSVALMDAYLKSEEKGQDTRDIHLIGVAAMFSAMKFEEIHPLKLSLIAEKIARKKFQKRDIIDKQSRILAVLNFELEFSTAFDLVKHLNYEIKLNLKPKLIQYLENILLYLSKMCTFSHELVTRPNCILASAIYFIALKTLEQVNKNFCPETILPNICAFTSVSEEQILSVGREVLHLAKNFSKSFPSLNNLKKFNKFQYHQE